MVRQMRSIVGRRLAWCMVLVGLFALGGVALAQSGPPDGRGGGGGGETSVPNNLSVPVIFTGAPLPLNGTMLQYSFGGEFWYGWVDPLTLEQLACDPEVAGCPPAGVELFRIYLQQDPLNVWQAEHADLAGPWNVDFVDWSDNLESQVWSTSSVVRVEVVPYAFLPNMLGFEMWWASGKGTDEMWGAKATNPVAEGDPAPAPPTTYYPLYGTIHTANAVLTIQKLQAGSGSQAAPPAASAFVWDVGTRQWLAADPLTMFTPATPAGYPAALTAELNIGGKVMFGYNWQLRRLTMPAGVTKDGWWRLTYSTTDNAVVFTGSTQLGPPVAAAVSEEGGTPLFTPVVDLLHNITYIDVYISASKGGGRKP